jgi:hypothetical protein
LIPKTVVCLAGLLLLSGGAQALQLGDVEIPEQVTLAGVDAPLVLNGAGIRKKFFINVYVAAFYLPQPERVAARLLSAPPVNRLTMTFVFPKVNQGQMEEGWQTGFEKNLTPAQFAAVSDRLAEFSALFGDMRQGDVVVFDYRPEAGTTVTINGQQRGLIAGADFNAALLSVWFGREPVTEALKNDLLGVDK